MSKKTLLERAYLHINNGGLTFSVEEKVDIRKDCTIFPEGWPDQIRNVSEAEREAIVEALPREVHHNRRWRLKVETYHFGARTSYSFPIVPLSVKWMIAALQRVLARMEAPQELPTDGLQFAFESQDYVRITAQDGQQVDTCWPVTPQYSEDGEKSSD